MKPEQQAILDDINNYSSIKNPVILLKTIIEKAIYAAALIKLYQPFFDGNNRTALVVLKDILNKKGIYFDYEHAAKDMEEHSLTIPTIYKSNTNIEFNI